MAQSGVISKIKTIYGTTEVTITGVTQTSNSPPLLAEGLPYGSAEVIVTGTAPTSVALQASNDGVNFVTIGALATAFPAISALSVSSFPAPAKFYQFLVVGGDGTTSITIICLLMGTRG